MISAHVAGTEFGSCSNTSSTNSEVFQPITVSYFAGSGPTQPEDVEDALLETATNGTSTNKTAIEPGSIQ